MARAQNNRGQFGGAWNSARLPPMKQSAVARDRVGQRAVIDQLAAVYQGARTGYTPN